MVDPFVIMQLFVVVIAMLFFYCCGCTIARDNEHGEAIYPNWLGMHGVQIHQPQYPSAAASGGGPAPVPPPTVEEVQLTIFNEGSAHEKTRGCVECAICLGGLEDGERLRLLTQCNHIFHVECIDRWLASDQTCPICRVQVK